MIRGLRRRRRVVLDFANPYPGLGSIPEIGWFAESVQHHSHGGLRIRFRDSWTAPHDQHEEVTVAEDVIRGAVDLAWAGSRVFGKLGVAALDALEAPLLLDTVARQRLLFQSDVVAPMLLALERIGLIGLAVLPGEHRKPFGFRRPLQAASDFEGACIRTHESTVSERAYTALGAIPRVLARAEMRDAPSLVDGMDIHPSAAASWSFPGYLTWNVNLWPRLPTIVANRARFNELPVAVQQLLRQAAAETVQRAVRTLADQAHPPSAHGLVVVESSPAQIAELRHRLSPVYDELRNDPETASFLAAIESAVVNSGASN